MKFCALPESFRKAIHGVVQKVSSDKDHAAIIGVDDEAMVVMSLDRYTELVEAANKTTVIKDYYPYWSPRIWYTNTYSNLVLGSTSTNDYPTGTFLNNNTSEIKYFASAANNGAASIAGENVTTAKWFDISK